MARVFNFSAGPAVLPEEVLREAQEALWNLDHTGIGVLALLRAERALETLEVAGAMSLEGLRGTPDAFAESIQRIRPQPGQLLSARRLRALLPGEARRRGYRQNLLHRRRLPPHPGCASGPRSRRARHDR